LLFNKKAERELTAFISCRLKEQFQGKLKDHAYHLEMFVIAWLKPTDAAVRNVQTMKDIAFNQPKCIHDYHLSHFNIFMLLQGIIIINKTTREI
jgi:hypothetical protein